MVVNLTVVEGEQTVPVDGEIITFGGIGDINGKTGGSNQMMVCW